VIVFLTHGTEPCAVVFDNIRKLVSFRRKYFFRRCELNRHTFPLKVQKRDSDLQFERLDRALDGELMICRGC
jgi:hypothetical protein